MNALARLSLLVSVLVSVLTLAALAYWLVALLTDPSWIALAFVLILLDVVFSGAKVPDGPR